MATLHNEEKVAEKITDDIRRKVLGRSLYEECLMSGAIVPFTTDIRLKKRLKELHQAGLFKDCDVEDIARICNFKKHPTGKCIKTLHPDDLETSYFLGGTKYACKLKNMYSEKEECLPGCNTCICDKVYHSFQANEDKTVLETMESVVEQVYKTFKTIMKKDPTCSFQTLKNSRYALDLPVFSKQQIAEFDIKKELIKHLKNFKEIYGRDVVEDFVEQLSHASSSKKVEEIYNKIAAATSNAAYKERRALCMYSLALIAACNAVIQYQTLIQQDRHVQLATEYVTGLGWNEPYLRQHTGPVLKKVVEDMTRIRRKIMAAMAYMHIERNLQERMEHVNESIGSQLPEHIRKFVMKPYMLPKME